MFISLRHVQVKILPLHQLSAVCLLLLISIFAAHLQHAHADGLFNNGLHFGEEK